MKNGKFLTYYFDSSAFDHVVKDRDADNTVAFLKELRTARRAVSYLSAWNVTELLIAFEKKPELSQRLIRAAREICSYRLIRDTPELLSTEFRHLHDPSVDTDPLTYASDPEPAALQADFDQFLADPSKLAPVIRVAIEDATRRKRGDEARQTNFVEALKKTDGFDGKAFKDVDDFFDWAFRRDTFALTVAKACYPERRSKLTPEQCAARLSETVAYRALVYFELSLIYYKNFTTLKRFQKHWGDAIDTHHVVYGAHFDIFVSEDSNCRTYAAKGAEGNTRIMGLKEFLEFAKGL